jgi:glucose/arabinose dehydrogenase
MCGHTVPTAPAPRRAAAALLGACLVLGSCNGDRDQGSTETGTTIAGRQTTAVGTGAPASPAPAATTPVAPDVAAPTGAPASSSTPPSPTAPAMVAETVVGEPVVDAELIATLDAPVGLGVRPGDPALYVLEQAGRVTKLPDATVVADVSERVDAGGERGLLGIAFSADGARAWLNYTDNDGDTVIAEYPVAGDGAFDVGSERVLLTIDQPYANHNGGDLMLGPDGMLYIATGDGGSGGDPQRRASDPQQLLGKLLRIDPNPTADAPYGVPADNPFGNEVWSYGLRNPWKIAFDAVTGDLWVADVGQNEFEEVNVVAPTDRPAGWGANFGWSAFEGTARYNEDVADPGDTVFPVFVYSHADGCSISGGAVYRGTAIAELAPAYVYSDYCSGTLWAYDLAGQRNLALRQMEGVTAVRSGPDGELYVLQAGGDVLRLVQG